MHRESSGALSANDGFSVVAPINVTVPSSTWGKNASCCALLKRCISSTNKIVRPAPIARRSRACSTITRTSATPPSTALKATNVARVDAAITCASVVFPAPGGPQRMTLGRRSAAIARARGPFAQMSSRCPTTSASELGRMRSASGAEARAR